MSDIWSGAFALGGVALGGAINELRAWRDAREVSAVTRQKQRREAYVRSLAHIEVVASACARVTEAADDATRVAAVAKFWQVITAAYEQLGELRLAVRDKSIAEEVNELLRAYRTTVGVVGAAMPQQSDRRTRVVDLMRRELKA